MHEPVPSTTAQKMVVGQQNNKLKKGRIKKGSNIVSFLNIEP